MSRAEAIARGLIRPAEHGPTPQAWRDDVPCVRLDQAGKDEAKRELAARRRTS
jgi:hypothetical protein